MTVEPTTIAITFPTFSAPPAAAVADAEAFEVAFVVPLAPVADAASADDFPPFLPLLPRSPPKKPPTGPRQRLVSLHLFRYGYTLHVPADGSAAKRTSENINTTTTAKKDIRLTCIVNQGIGKNREKKKNKKKY
jgi:hypothetical protein